jgi:predicted DNA binding protein
MWIAKFKHRHGDCVTGTRTKKFNCIAYQYLIKHYQKKENFYFTTLSILIGKEKDKNRFINDLKKEKRIHNLEIESDLILTTYKEKSNKKFYEHIFNPEILYPKPIIIDNEGWESYEIACWKKEPLMKFINASKEHFEFRFGSIKENKSEMFFIPRSFPKLTEKQKEAFTLASKEGYYNFPRKTDLKKLSKKMNITRQTFQQHLRIAEKKIMNSVEIN